MKEFFLILFFAKSVLITPEPVDIINSTTFTFGEPISAITSGAHVRIDVSRSVGAEVDLADIVGVLEHLDQNFPNGSVTATLTTASGKTKILDVCSGSTNGKNAELILSSSSGIPTQTGFIKLQIDSSIDLLGVTVKWRNHQK